MTDKYNINFVPHINDKKKISSLRKEICKKCFTTQALQYPVHLSLASGSDITDYKLFDKELIELCKKLKPIKIISSDKKTTVYSEGFWTGLSFKNSSILTELQQKVERLKNKYSKTKTHLRFIPHITLAFPAKIDNLEPTLNPIKELLIDRITIAKKETGSKKYKVFKHYNLGK